MKEGMRLRPMVTIGIPTYNRSGLLRQAVDSALAQSYENIEVIVADNASTDDTASVLSGYGDRIRVIRQRENIGLFPNWQACLSAAQGEYFTLLSDDDYLQPNAIELLMDGFSGADDSIAFVYGKTAKHRAGAGVLVVPNAPEYETAASHVAHFFDGLRALPPGANLCRREDLVSAGGFNFPGLAFATDAALSIKTLLLRPCARVRFIDSVVLNYRIHAENASHSITIPIWVRDFLIIADLVLSSPNLSTAEKGLIKRSIDNFVVRHNFFIALQRAKKTRFFGRFDIVKKYCSACAPHLSLYCLLRVPYGILRIALPYSLGGVFRKKLFDMRSETVDAP